MFSREKRDPCLADPSLPITLPSGDTALLLGPIGTHVRPLEFTSAGCIVSFCDWIGHRSELFPIVSVCAIAQGDIMFNETL